MLEARLLRRYKRFLADVELADGSIVTAHCPNTGSMTGCAPEGARVWLSISDNPKRKYRYTWELVEPAKGQLACINTSLTNRVVEEAVISGIIPTLRNCSSLRREVPYGEEKSRIDLLLQFGDRRCYTEVKHVTLLLGDGVGAFPDAVSKRGSKHLRELMQRVHEGERAALVFAVMHSGIETMNPADHIDPEYGRLLRQAVESGVEVMAYRITISTKELKLTEPIEVFFPPIPTMRVE